MHYCVSKKFWPNLHCIYMMSQDFLDSQYDENGYELMLLFPCTAQYSCMSAPLLWSTCVPLSTCTAWELVMYPIWTLSPVHCTYRNVHSTIIRNISKNLNLFLKKKNHFSLLYTQREIVLLWIINILLY